MISRRLRWTLAGLAIVALVIPVLFALHIGPDAAWLQHAGASPRERHGAAIDAAPVPLPALSVLHADIAFTARGGQAAKGPAISASAGILVDLDSRQILWQLNPHDHLAPASTIKMLTALVVLENFNPDATITASVEALNQAADETKMGLQPGERLSVRDLLTGMLMVSANDAASVFAYDTVGLRRFVAAMNAQVSALGLHDTHASSPVGLDDSGMYSSAYDLAVIGAEVTGNFTLFRNIVETHTATIPPSAEHGPFALANVNRLLDKYPAAVGIKPGWTGDAGACEVGMAVRSGHRLISVLLHGTLVYTESARLLDWGFEQEGLAPLLPSAAPH